MHSSYLYFYNCFFRCKHWIIKSLSIAFQLNHFSLFVSNNLYYFSSEGVSKYIDSNQSFITVDPFSELLNSYSTRSTLMDVKGSYDIKWCFANENILLLSPGSITEIPKTEIIPVSLSNFKKVVNGFENLTKIQHFKISKLQTLQNLKVQKHQISNL